MNQVYKNLALWMVIGLIVILLFTVFSNTQPGGQESPNFSEFLKAVEQGRVESVVIRGNLVTYNLRDGSPTQRTYIVDYPDLVKMLRDKGVRIAVKPPDSNPWYAIFLQWVPMLLFIGVWIFFMRQMQGACFFPCSNKSRTRDAPTPTNISTKSDPEMEKNGTLASPAMALASSVLPVPGGPTSSAPLGMRPPRRWYFLGFFRKSTSSISSALASSTPATSLNVVLSSLRS